MVKRCRTVNGLVSAIKRGEPAVLTVWGINRNHFDKHGAYLNLGGNRFSCVGKETWRLIKGCIRKPDGSQFSSRELQYPFF